MKLVIYRDGVSEGEYLRVMQTEIGQVERTAALTEPAFADDGRTHICALRFTEALDRLDPKPPYRTAIVYIVVGKRWVYIPKLSSGGSYCVLVGIMSGSSLQNSKNQYQ